ncbi:cytochrome P450 [Kutzneria sp. CA-103260]|uniref:cytochrome P450 n=1 Tax=Kutzneria sp. CA-103260 TaxID=2802641 RepID=UPI001BAC7D49|nr:cytochrome P450 [Kutzneria sp. CA-103260]QUQ63511.1 cytochrome P450 monooxygenase [Kutzneria sp. CA-103260]
MTANQRRFAFRTLSFLDSLDEQHGVVTLTPRRLLVSSPEAVGRIFRADRRACLEGTSTLGPLVGPRSLLFANGARHTAYRKTIGPALRGDRLRGVVLDTARAEIDRLTPGSVITLPAWTRSVTLKVIGRVVLGDADPVFLRSFTEWVEGALGSRRRTLLYRHARLHPAVPSPWRTFLRQRETIDRELLAHVRTRASDGSIAGLLLSGGTPLGVLDDDELRDQLVSLLFAGHETTASALAWTLYWLHQNENVRRDLLDELAASDEAGETPLLDAVCHESLRLSPPAMIAGNRVFDDASDLVGRELPAGSRLTPCIYLAHRRRDAYSDPHRFDPQRFLGRRPSSQQYFPFGGGVRRCLGADLAMTELRMITAAVLSGLSLRCVNPELGVPHLRGPAMGPGPGLRMEVLACRR